MNLIEIVTARVNRYIPRRACGWEFSGNGIRYMHPTKGWKNVSFKRMGLRLG